MMHQGLSSNVYVKSSNLCHSLANFLKNFELPQNFFFLNFISFLSHIIEKVNFSFNDITKVTSPYHLCVECFSQLSIDSEMYTKSAAVAGFVYTSESNESCEKHSTQR